MKSILLTLLLTTAFSSAVTISVSRAGEGLIPVTTAGTALSTGGYYIGVGSFDVVPTITGPASLQAAVTAFNVFASATSPTTGGTVGTIVGSFTAAGGANPDKFNSSSIYFLIGNAATKDASTEFAIFSATPNALFTANVAVSGTVNIALQNVSSIQPLEGAGTEVDNASPVKDQLRLATTVPEPSSAILVAAFGLLTIGRRRRA